nr:9136_t:CDS:2 [Entrophospora candida]
MRDKIRQLMDGLRPEFPHTCSNIYANNIRQTIKAVENDFPGGMKLFAYFMIPGYLSTSSLPPIQQKDHQIPSMRIENGKE